jgi:polyisoprenoid-binding protein YceI
MSTAATRPFAGTYVADRHSSVVFAIQHMGIAMFRGSFDEVEARLVADEDGIRIEGTVRVESISIGDPPEFRQHVVDGDDFLDAATLGEDGRVAVEGRLSIRDVVRAVTATGTYRGPVADPFGGDRIALALSTTLDRRDWGMTWQQAMPNGTDALGWAVEVEVQLELIRR